MGIRTSPAPSHWNYFLAIERDLERLSRFIEFDERNFKSFSLEAARILLAAAAEVDVVCKQVCHAIDRRSAADNIRMYRDVIVPRYPLIPEFCIEIPRFGLELRPWDEWKRAGRVPLWWTAYNKTKHHRNTHFPEANLKNALNAVAGLFVVTLYRYPIEASDGRLVPLPQLLRPSMAHVAGTTYNDVGDFGINYDLRETAPPISDARSDDQ
jgi:hypothetical protein